MRVVFLTCLLMALPNVALGSDQSTTTTHPHEFSTGLATSFFASNWYLTPTAWTVDIAYHHRPKGSGLWRSLRFTEGFRIGSADDDQGVFDVYWRAEMIATVGPWTPTLGPELGVSSLGNKFIRFESSFPDDFKRIHEEKLSPLYVAFVATPLRFCFSRFTVSALQLSLGAPIQGIGTIARVQLGVLQLGGTL